MSNYVSRDDETRVLKDRIHALEQEVLEANKKTKQVEEEFNEYREQSAYLEKELESELEHSKKTTNEYRVKCNRLSFDCETFQGKIAALAKENANLISQLSKFRENEENLVKLNRKLEQDNDDIKRRHREVLATMEDIQVQLDGQIEKNALLETELDEKDTLLYTVQRDLKEELARQHDQALLDNHKSAITWRVPRAPNASMDSNKLQEKEALTTPTSPVKMSSSMTQLPPPTRLSAINLVGDLLRKVGSLESKLAVSRIPKESVDSPSRESCRARTQRLARPSPSPAMQKL